MDSLPTFVAPDASILLAAIGDESADAIYAKDRDGRLLYANPAALRLIGKDASRVIGHTDAEFLDDPRAAAQVMANDSRIMAIGVAEEVEEDVPYPDGTSCLWLSRKMPWRDADGRVVGLLGISRDITERKRLELELRASKDALQRVLDSISDGLAIFDRDWSYVHLSEQGARLLGMEREALIGRNLWEAFPHAYDSAFGAAYREAMDTGRRTQVEAFYPAPLDMWIEANCYPGPDGVSIFFRDVTARHSAADALAASEARLRRIFEASPMGMVTGDAAGRILSANDAFLRIVGYSRAELDAGEVRWDRLTPPEWLEVDHRAIAEVERDGLSAVFEKEYVRRDGQRVPVMIAVARFDESDPLIAFVIDIGDRKRAEEAVRQASTRKDEFLAMLAHELRNPLAPLGTSAYLLRLAADDPQRVRGVAEVVDRQVRHLGALVDDLLDVSRVTRGHVELANEPVDLKAVVATAIEQARPLVDARGHALAVRQPSDAVVVRGDAQRLVQVLSNLLNNAAKYTPAGGHVELALEAGDGEARITVCDDGAGIEPGLLPHVFDLFTQGARSPDRAQGGLGIGLALVRSLVALHGGRVEARSDGLHRGSTFTVLLPLAAAELPGGEAHVDAPPSGNGRVLVVDDNRDAADTIAEMLRLSGFDVVVAHTGHGALEAAANGEWRAFVLDIGLPDMTGYELGQRLRAGPAGHGARLIALSGYGQDHDRALSRAAGFDLHFVKPVEPLRLLDALGVDAR